MSEEINQTLLLECSKECLEKLKKGEMEIPRRTYSPLYRASQFRRLGIAIPEEIPDHAEIPQFSCETRVEILPQTEEHPKFLGYTLNWTYVFTRPFKW